MSKEVKKNEVQKRNLPDIGKQMISRLVDQVVAFANIESTPLTDKEKSYATGIVFAVIKRAEEEKLDWKVVDVKNVVEQIKSYARLGLSISDNEIYIDIRSNSKTGKKEINIKKQYQGIEKELVKWCNKKIVRFYQDVICVGDKFVTKVDFETGLKKVVEHEKNTNIDRNQLENIIGAYKIAYVDERDDGTLTQYMVEIDKNRIMRAYNASPTKEKPIWKADTQRMVLKTASWCLYNYVLKPFVNVPVELKRDWERTKDNYDFDNAEEVAAEEIETYANTGEVLDMPTEPVLEEVQEEPKEEQQQNSERVTQSTLFDASKGF